MTRRYLALMIAPVSPSNGRTVEQNTAKLWYPFLREITADLPITIVCSWLVGIMLGDDDNSPEQRERGIVDSETGAARCDLTIAVGQSPSLTTGMQREHAACPGPCVDLLDLGREYEQPKWMAESRREEIRERIRQALRSLESVEAETLADEDKPLTASVTSGVLRIEIGVGTLAFATLRSQYVADMMPGRKRFESEIAKRFTITSAAGFAEEVQGALLAEEEDGSSMLTDLLDEAARMAIEDGAEHFVDAEDE